MSNASDFVIENGVLKKYQGPGGDVVIPEGVTEIGDNAFRGCDTLISIEVSDDVRTIGKRAFKECKLLRSARLPRKLKGLRNNAFESCIALEGIDLPDSLTDIGDRLFCDCKKLKTIRLPKGIKRIHLRMFSGCTLLENIELPESVQFIESYAFDHTDLLEIKLPNKLKWIGNYSFCGCRKLKTIRLPEGLEHLGDGAFEYTSIQSIVIPESVTDIGGSAFAFTDLQSVVIPEGVKNIGANAFQLRGKAKITVLGKPSLGKDSFDGPFLATKLPLNEITSTTHKRLAVLGWILSSENDPVVDEKAAKSFRKYWTAHLEAFMDIFDKNETFFQALVEKQLLTLEQTGILMEKLRDHVEMVAVLLEYKQRQFSRQTIEANEEKKTEKQLREPNASELRKIWTCKTLPEGKIQLNQYRSEETEILVPERIGSKTVTILGWSCFHPYYDAPNKAVRENITSVTLPSQLEGICCSAFYGCEQLQEITMNEGLRFIGESAFSSCVSLKTVVIPKSVACIFFGAFAGCHQLTDVYILSTETKFEMIGERNWDQWYQYQDYIRSYRSLDKPKPVFMDCPYLTIHAPAGSYAEQYAKENNISFVAE